MGENDRRYDITLGYFFVFQVGEVSSKHLHLMTDDFGALAFFPQTGSKANFLSSSDQAAQLR